MGVKAAIFASAGKRTEHVIPGVYSRSTAIPNISGGVSAGNLCIMGKSNAGKPHAVLAFASLIMDNARFHRKEQLKEIGEKQNGNWLFLPPYSPDFNPIEKNWANMKRALRDTAPLYALLENTIYNYWC